MKPNLLNLNSPILHVLLDIHLQNSRGGGKYLCSLYCSVVSEQRKTEVWFLATRKMEREQRSSKLWFLVLCSETARKRLFACRLLGTNVNGEAGGGGEGVDGVDKERQLVHLLFKTLKHFRSHPESRLNFLSRAKISLSVPLR